MEQSSPRTTGPVFDAVNRGAELSGGRSAGHLFDDVNQVGWQLKLHLQERQACLRRLALAPDHAGVAERGEEQRCGWSTR